MKVAIILNDPPSGTERSFNALLLAGSMVLLDEYVEIDIVLTADAVGCAKSGQQVPAGYYSLERMLKPVLRRGRVLA